MRTFRRDDVTRPQFMCAEHGPPHFWIHARTVAIGHRHMHAHGREAEGGWAAGIVCAHSVSFVASGALALHVRVHMVTLGLAWHVRASIARVVTLALHVRAAR